MFKLFEFTRAVGLYKKARQLKPNDMDVTDRISQLEYQERRIQDWTLLNPNADGFTNLINSYLNTQATADLPNLYFERAKIYEKNNNITEALQDLKRVIQVAPTHRSAHIKIGDLEFQLNRDDRAMENYSKALGLFMFKEDVSLLRKLATLAKESYDYEAARQYLTKALELDDSAAELYHELGNVLVDFGQQNLAVFNFQEAVKLDANYAEAWYALAEAQRNLRAFAEAGAAYRKAVQLRPGWRENVNQNARRQLP